MIFFFFRFSSFQITKNRNVVAHFQERESRLSNLFDTSKVSTIEYSLWKLSKHKNFTSGFQNLTTSPPL